MELDSNRIGDSHTKPDQNKGMLVDIEKVVMEDMTYCLNQGKKARMVSFWSLKSMTQMRKGPLRIQCSKP